MTGPAANGGNNAAGQNATVGSVHHPRPSKGFSVMTRPGAKAPATKKPATSKAKKAAPKRGKGK